ncbi:MAG: hypothetical protein U0T74_10430 [Chitinophagales bacterium]
MKTILFAILIFTSLTGYSQDSTIIKLAEYKQLYQNKKISLEKYQELSKQLLRPVEPVNLEDVDATFDTTNFPRTEEYCLIIGYAKLFSSKVTIHIDFGQKRKYFADSRLKDASGRLVEFESMIDALNFMNSKGWELYAAYPMTSSSGSAYHYLLKRKLSRL